MEPLGFDVAYPMNDTYNVAFARQLGWKTGFIKRQFAYIIKQKDADDIIIATIYDAIEHAMYDRALKPSDAGGAFFG
jgi:hypothetical protein